VGATGELSLRVSVASLVKVMFTNPGDGKRMLALERTATVQERQGMTEVNVKAKPFGGAVHLVNPRALRDLVANFHYDSPRSRQESDFRIMIHPALWEKIKELCRQHLIAASQSIIDPNPGREMAEEFEDALHINLKHDQYQAKLRGMVIEDQPIQTENVRAPGFPTVRVYYIFDAWIDDPGLIAKILANYHENTDQGLQELALCDARQGGRGRANAILTLKLDNLVEFCRSLTQDMHKRPIQYQDHLLADNVLSLLDEVDQGRYKTFIH
jgi:hypothetical protein